MTIDRVLALSWKALERTGIEPVLVGGRAFALLAEDERSADQSFEPLTTRDVDILLLRRSSNGLAREALLSAGFREDARGVGESWSTRWTLEESPAAPLQMIAPRSGDSERRKTVRIGGLLAECLPHLEILGRSTLRVRPLSDLAICAPHPVAFALQKLLVQADRIRVSPNRASRDLVYVHDTLRIAPPGEPFCEEGLEEVRGGLSKREHRRLLRHLEALASKRGESVSEAARIMRMIGRPSPPSRSSLLTMLVEGVRAWIAPV